MRTAAGVLVIFGLGGMVAAFACIVGISPWSVSAVSTAVTFTAGALWEVGRRYKNAE